MFAIKNLATHEYVTFAMQGFNVQYGTLNNALVYRSRETAELVFSRLASSDLEIITLSRPLQS